MADKSHIKYYVVDAFAESPLTGNPAAVCLLENEKEEPWLQGVAREFNLSATCYLMKVVNDDHENDSDVPKFQLRWFAPSVELNICGHGTIASSYILFQHGLVKGRKVEFHTKSGKLLAERIEIEKTDKQFSIRLTFPSIPLVECSPDEKEMASKVANGAHQPIKTVKMAYEEEIIVEYASGTLVANLQPSIDEIRKWRGRGIVVTGAAPEGSGFDFYSRFICPNLGMVEDPVCGSVHCGLTPYWSKKLGKSDLKAYMVSSRGGILNLHMDDEKKRVFIQGKAVLVMEGSLFID